MFSPQVVQDDKINEYLSPPRVDLQASHLTMLSIVCDNQAVCRCCITAFQLVGLVVIDILQYVGKSLCF